MKPAAAVLANLLYAATAFAAPPYAAELVFPLHPKHNHAPGIVECPNGDLIASWYRGSGERSADDVAVYGARKRKGADSWSEPFLLVDNQGFPDCNTALFIDAQNRLWLFWPVILDNQWSSCLTNYRIASKYDADGPPAWDWQGALYLKPKDFEKVMLRGLEDRAKMFPDARRGTPEQIEQLKQRIGNKLSSRLGWQPRCKPTVLPSGRILLPLYSDTFSVSVMAISDDGGKSWYASEPLAGYGSIQPAVLRRNDGTLVAYMRENGPIKRIRVSESKDEGVSWGPVGATDLPNPGSGLDAVRLANGHWLLVRNDTVAGRNSLAVSISDDEGKTWKWTRHLEKHATGSYHYPAMIQGRDGTIHVIYTYGVSDGKSMKHAAFTEVWVREGDTPAEPRPTPSAARPIPSEPRPSPSEPRPSGSGQGTRPPAVVAPTGRAPWGRYAARPDDWYRSPDGRRAADNLLSQQSPLGSWPKNFDTSAKAYDGNPADIKGTFDNGATIGEIRFLARAYRVTQEPKYRDAVLKGIDHILKAQYTNGGWPQSYPPGKGYPRHITFNDNAMVNLMRLLREVATADSFAFVDVSRRQAAQTAFDRGVDCILKCQIVINGKKTAWCAQHDATDFQPRPARTYELVSLSGSESVEIVRLLMSLEKPSPEIAAAIEGAVKWFDEAKLPGIKQVFVPDPQAPRGRNRVVVKDPDAPPLWARFYEIGTNRPIFSDRDGVAKRELADIGYERRNGYAWLGTWPADLLAKDYPAWKTKWRANDGK